ncbi:MAG: hypothetical protein WC707_00200 [Candidatus Babeliaceae bacterium]|jgi:hypothetical protein
MNTSKIYVTVFTLLFAGAANISYAKKSNYAPYFENIPGDSPIKKTCSTITGNKKIDDACVELSNFLYCIQQENNQNKPAECKQFCDEQSINYSGFFNIVKILQQELHLSPKHFVDFSRDINKPVKNAEPEKPKTPKASTHDGLDC